jgi:hypothetical protein
MVGFTGYADKGLKIAVGYGLYLVGKAVGMPKAGLAAAIGAFAVTAKEFSDETGVTSTINGLLGNVPQYNSVMDARLNSFARNVSGYVPSTMGYVPSLNGAGVDANAGG